MDTQYAIFIAVAAGAFAIALLAVMAQWLKADDAALDAEVGVRDTMRRLQEQTQAGTDGNARTVSAPGPVIAPDPTPGQTAYKLADDETALSRLLLGWSASGTFIGLVIGAAIWGPMGALLGGVVLAAVSVVGVVVAVLVVDRVRTTAAERRRVTGSAGVEVAPASVGVSAESKA